MSDTFLLCLQLTSQDPKEVFTVLFTHLILTNNLGQNHYGCMVLFILCIVFDSSYVSHETKLFIYSVSWT